METDWDEIWSSLGDGMADNPARKLRYEAIVAELKPGKILDFGAGDGQLVRYLNSLNFDAIGYEISKKGVDRSKRISSNYNLKNSVFHMESLKDIEGVYDVIILSEVVEHILDPEITLRHLKSHLASSGIFIITVPAGPMSYFEKYIGHHMHYSKRKIVKLFDKSGLVMQDFYRTGFPILTLVRGWSLLRGKKFIKDLENSQKITRFSGILDSIILKLTSASKHKNPFGWQIIATAKKN